MFAIDDINKEIYNYLSDRSLIILSSVCLYTHQLMKHNPWKYRMDGYRYEIKMQFRYNPSIDPISGKRIKPTHSRYKLLDKHFTVKDKYILSPKTKKLIVIGNPSYLNLLEEYNEYHLLYNRKLKDRYKNCIHYIDFVAYANEKYECKRCDEKYNTIYKNNLCPNRKHHVFIEDGHRCKYCCLKYHVQDCNHSFET